DIRRACGDLVAHVSIEPERPVDGREESQFFTDLQQAIDRETACDIVYQPPIDREPIACRLRPYAMHLANNAWYVLGVTDHPDHAGEVRVFKLVRLQEVTPTEVRFTRPPGFRVSDKLGLAWRLNPEGKEHDVAVEFAPMVATNVAEVRWHETQRVEWLKTGGGSGSGSGGCRLHFRVDGLKEIAWWVCGYADQARVVKPAALRRMVAAMHRDAAERNAD
ncbi:MAG: WYL domain-containing protein, partial [Planctomycetota bacterium]